MIKIIATDMDHTLLNDHSVLPKEFSDTLDALIDNNIEFVCASGRSLVSLHNKVHADKNRVSFVSDNGSIVEYHGEIIFKSVLETKEWHKMVLAARKTDKTTIILTTIDGALVELHDEEHRELLSEYYPVHTIVNDVLEQSLEVIKVTFLNLHTTEVNFDTVISPQFSKDFNAVRAGHMWIDIMNKGVNKGNGLKILLDRFDLHSDNLMSFGDYHNDIEMLQLAAHSFAVSNAHDDVKAVAKEVIQSNNDNAVIKTIHARVLNK